MPAAREPWLLPEGVEESLPEEAARLESARRDVLDLFDAWGYRQVIPPFIEYLDSLLTGTGRDLELQTLKLTDQLSGRLLGVRADMTPQVARIDARHLDHATPARLCYVGTVLRSLPEGLGASRSPVQVGAELYGHPGAESDCEVVSLMLDALQRCGLEGVLVDLGHVGIFRGLVRECGIEPDAERALYDALQRKAAAELDALLAPLTGNAAAAMLRDLASLNGGPGVLDTARERLAGAGKPVREALERLARLVGLLRARVPEIALHLDLAELRGYRYHTGVVFAAYVPGHGEEVARGGRYDGVGTPFGRARPATGFSADLKTLVRLGARPVRRRDKAVLAPWVDCGRLHREVRALRDGGERVVQALPGAPAPPDADRALREENGHWVVVPVDDTGGG